MILIPLGEDRPEPNPVITGEERVGWDPDLSADVLWKRNRSHWGLNLTRAAQHSHVAFQWHGKIVQVAKIDRVVVSEIPNKIVFEGEPLPDDHPFARLLVGKPSSWHRNHYLTDDEFAEIITG